MRKIMIFGGGATVSHSHTPGAPPKNNFRPGPPHGVRIVETRQWQVGFRRGWERVVECVARRHFVLISSTKWAILLPATDYPAAIFALADRMYSPENRALRSL